MWVSVLRVSWKMTEVLSESKREASHMILTSPFGDLQKKPNIQNGHKAEKLAFLHITQ